LFLGLVWVLLKEENDAAIVFGTFSFLVVVAWVVVVA
jgi:hypothetical protein